MISISKNCDPNYLATVIECPELKQHPNADRLEIATVFGGDVIVAKGQYQKGEPLCYFPVESCISQKFLAWANLLDKAESNADGKTKGFFSTKGGDGYSRVKAVKLREIPSQGFLFKVSKLAEYYGVKESVFKLGESFDTVNDDLLAKKYVSGERKSGNQNESKKRIPKWIENTVRVFPLPIRKRLYTGINYLYDKNKQGIGSLIVDGQWHFHGSTEQLGKNIFKVDPDNDVVVSCKMHGCVKHDTPIETLEYGFLPIKKIVDERLAVHVRGYDTEKDEIKWVKVDDYYFKKNDGVWYEVELEDGQKIVITGNNPVWMADLDCYRKVENLKIGDVLLVKNDKT
jgi:hypothetical protein